MKKFNDNLPGGQPRPLKLEFECASIRVFDDVTICELTCRLNLHDFERRYAMFSNAFISKKIRDILPVSYYKSESTMEYYDINSGTGAKSKTVVYSKGNYDYSDQFTVIATAKPAPGDTFSMEKGRRIALAKARIKARYTAMRLAETLFTLMTDAALELENLYAKHSHASDLDMKYLSNLASDD